MKSTYWRFEIPQLTHRQISLLKDSWERAMLWMRDSNSYGISHRGIAEYSLDEYWAVIDRMVKR